MRDSSSYFNSILSVTFKMSDDEDAGIPRNKVLPVADFDDYDPSVPPSSGEEYLRRVQLEAAKCPDIVSSKIDQINQSAVTDFDDTRPDAYRIPSNGFIKATSDQLMPEDLQHSAVTGFTLLRMRIDQMKSKIDPAVVDKRRSEFRVQNNPKFWKEYCMSQDHIPESNGDTESEGDDSSSKKLPFVSLLMCLDQSELCDLLSYHVKWIKEDGYCDNNGLWIYSILACIEKPLSSDFHSVLRNISRVCSEFRSNHKADGPQLTSINLMICIIGRYFNQLDMIDSE